MMSTFPRLFRPLSLRTLQWLCAFRAIYCESTPITCEYVSPDFIPAMASHESTPSSAIMFTRISKASGTSCDIAHECSEEKAWNSILRLAERGEKYHFIDHKAFANIRSRHEQLNLQDDPAFIPDFNIDLDLSLFDIPLERSSSRASSQLPSLAGSSHASLSDQEPQLELPSEGTPGFGIGGFDFGAGTSSVGQWGNNIRAPSVFEEPGIIDDPDLVIDEDGNMYTPTQRRQQGEVAQEALASLGIPGSKAGDSTGITDRVRADHEAGLQGDMNDQPFDFDDQPMFMADGDLPLPDAAPFSARQSSAAPPDGQPRQSSSAHPDHGASFIMEVAPQRRARAKPAIKVDVETQIPSKDLKAWDDNYVRNMAEVRMEHAYITSTLLQSKKNAEHLVLGIGLSGLGREFNTDLEHPLRQAFSGKAFFDTLAVKETSPAGRKRSRSPDEDEEEAEEGRRVRPRSDDDQEAARGGDDQFQFDDNDGMFVQGDDDVVSISSLLSIPLLITSPISPSRSVVTPHPQSLTSTQSATRCPGTHLPPPALAPLALPDTHPPLSACRADSSPLSANLPHVAIDVPPLRHCLVGASSGILATAVSRFLDKRRNLATWGHSKMTASNCLIWVTMTRSSSCMVLRLV
jgi:hypothetical protein